QEAAKGTQEVSSNITGVTQAAGDSGAAANQVLASSSGLSAQAQALRDEMGRLIREIRSA
ncbi:MAG: methyl-accepting chemotaxis protein, partial [Pseudomonadota bacterium]